MGETAAPKSGSARQWPAGRGGAGARGGGGGARGAGGGGGGGGGPACPVARRGVAGAPGAGGGAAGAAPGGRPRAPATTAAGSDARLLLWREEAAEQCGQ